MFSQISWTMYLQTMSVLVTLYYAAVLLIYFRKDALMRIFPQHKNSMVSLVRMPRQKEPAEESLHKGGEAGDPKAGNSYALLVETLTDEINAFFAEAGRAGFTKDQILISLQALLDKYASVKASPYKEKICNLIMEACLTHTSVVLSEQETEGLFTE